MNRHAYTCISVAAIAVLGVSSAVSFAPRLIWNASASTPIGLYAIEPMPTPRVQDLAAVTPPEPLAEFLDDGGYLPNGLPLLKHVAAGPGQRVCRIGFTITVDGRRIGDALGKDRRGRDLPSWDGCRLITDGELFFMNASVRDSLDGRYFGPLPARSIIGRAVPLYTDEAGDGQFVWRASAR